MAEVSPLMKAGQLELSRAERYKQLASLLRQWQAEPGDYDEKTWPKLESALKDSSLTCSETDESNS